MIIQPQAGIKIYNYEDRLGSAFYDSRKQSQDIEKVLKIKNEIISISTTKHKAQPSGEFQISLAPTRNWITTISTGSWISIHMSSTKISDDDLFSFNEKTLKMIGRIDSVRMSMTVDQATGARQTIYTIQGRDWGQVFESVLYIDPLLKPEIDKFSLALFTQEKFPGLYNNVNEKGLLSTTSLVQLILSVWGEQPITADKTINENKKFINVQSPFNIPKQLSSDLKLSSLSLSKSINLIAGRLVSNNKYDSKKPETYGQMQPQSFIGQNNIWQVMSAHCCQEINELLCDITWESGKPKLTLFKRVKPFALGSVKYQDANTESKFLDLYRTEIPKESILTLECGDNWRDRVNAVEILPAQPAKDPTAGIQQVLSKDSAQKADHVAIEREGLRPILLQTYYYPADSKDKMSYQQQVAKWIPTFVDWYFNIHKMLNGSLTFFGNTKHIPVGSNIVLDSSVFAKAPYVSGQENNSKFVAHVESVSHNFSVDYNGSRSYYCGINFVRGVFTDSKIKQIYDKDSYGIDTHASSIPDSKEITKATYEVRHG